MKSAKHPSLQLSHATSMESLSMPLSHTRERINSFALWKLLIQLSIQRSIRTPDTLLLSSMLTDSKIYQSYTELEILLEFTELTWDFITEKDNSMSTCTTKVHGYSTLQINWHLLDNQLERTYMHSQERNQLKRNKMQPLFQLWKNGQTNSSHQITFLMKIKSPH